MTQSVLAGKTALVTGASSGLGTDFARELGRLGCNVVIVARREDLLKHLQQELTGKFGINVTVVTLDLSTAEAPQALYDLLKQQNVQVDVLINNAGFGLFGLFAETSLDVELRMIQVNVTALTELTKRFAVPMLARRNGRIMNVASTAAFFPGPLMSVYYATKAYVLSFTEALANEFQGTGVTVTALCPGPTASGFQAAADLQASKLVAGKTLPTSAGVARFGWDAMMQGQVVAVHGGRNRAIVEMTRAFPRSVIRRMVRAVQDRRA